jgi:hypothetical protein
MQLPEAVLEACRMGDYYGESFIIYLNEDAQEWGYCSESVWENIGGEERPHVKKKALMLPWKNFDGIQLY